jgi:hypothetical protein
MKPSHLALLFGLCLLAFCVPQNCFGSSLYVGLAGGGEYVYSLDITQGDFYSFAPGDQFLLTGLSGVTAAFDGTGDGFFSAAFTSTSVTLTATESFEFAGPPLGVTDTFDPVAILFSNATELGLVNFSMDAFSLGPLAGTVEGPVSDVPEPATAWMVPPFLLGLLALARTRQPIPGRIATWLSKNKAR